jgi:hypothetical protein
MFGNMEDATIIPLPSGVEVQQYDETRLRELGLERASNRPLVLISNVSKKNWVVAKIEAAFGDTTDVVVCVKMPDLATTDPLILGALGLAAMSPEARDAYAAEKAEKKAKEEAAAAEAKATELAVLAAQAPEQTAQGG